MLIAIIIATLAALVAAAFGLVVAWDAIKPVTPHPDINKIQWPINHEKNVRAVVPRTERHS